MDTLPKELEILETADGSPTLAFSSNSLHERMHNSKGALGESFYIYGHALEYTLRESPSSKAQILSVGLGLGYCEMITFALALRHEKSIRMWSFESFEYLRESFLNWLQNRPSALSDTYLQILNGVAQTTKVDPRKLKATLTLASELGDWEIRHRFPEDTDNVQDVHCVLFDAYSSKTSPELWEEERLKSVLPRLLAPDCVFSTYAAKGSLNRALDFLHFRLTPRTGFGGKRQSTLALRGVYLRKNQLIKSIFP